MCGIAGIVSKSGVNTSTLSRISETLRHRGPDDEGFYISNSEEYFLKGNDTVKGYDSLSHILSFDRTESFPLALVHRRLSIIDLSRAGHQPMELNHLVIVFNGEIYNYREIRTELKKEGFTFRTESDTEVILAAYVHWGKSCVTKFIGMWAFAIYDRLKNELFLSRDRFGIKPLYYFFSAGLFAFASEIKALLEVKEIEPVASLGRTFEFIAYGATSNPQKNLFRNILQLPPGHHLIFNINEHHFAQEKYYDCENAVNNYRLPVNSHETFNALLESSVTLHLRSDVEIGSALSGGLDSGTLVAMAADSLKDKTFKTFTASYQEKGIDETGFADLVSGSRSNIRAFYARPTSENFWKDLDRLTWHQDLPVNSTSMFAQWEVMKAASQEKIKVLLDGQGADEILGGYYNFAGIYLLQLLKDLRFAKFSREHRLLKANFTPAINTAMGRAAFYFLPDSLQAFTRSRKRLSFDFISPEFRERSAQIKIPGRGGHSFKEQSHLSMAYGMQDLLRYEDRNSMAFGIESRVPFLDHRLVEFCIALHGDEKIKDGWTKFILRKKAEKILPAEVAWRKDKMGFLTPQQSWKNESKEELREFLTAKDLPAFVNKKLLLELAENDFAGAAQLSEFWKMISFLNWAKIFKVKFI
jgi:asparagine synthase (glutamine-hydrolysing)